MSKNNAEKKRLLTKIANLEAEIATLRQLAHPKFSDLVGKTIVFAVQMQHPRSGDRGWLRLSFTEGPDLDVISGYSGVNGDTQICLGYADPTLVPA